MDIQPAERRVIRVLPASVLGVTSFMQAIFGSPLYWFDIRFGVQACFLPAEFSKESRATRRTYIGMGSAGRLLAIERGLREQR